MFRSVLRLQPGPEGAASICAYYRDREVLLKALRDGGCLEAEVQVQLPDRDVVVVSALWSSADDYERWTLSGTRGTDAVDLEALLAPESLPLGSGDLYEVALTAPGPGR